MSPKQSAFGCTSTFIQPFPCATLPIAMTPALAASSTSFASVCISTLTAEHTMSLPYFPAPA